MTRPVVAFEIRGKDPAALQEFYRQIFGWKIEANEIGIAAIEPGVGGPEQGVGGFITLPNEPCVIIYVQVLDLNETLAKAESLGGSRVQEPFDVPNGPTVAQMADPEGNIIGLVKQ